MKKTLLALAIGILATSAETFAQPLDVLPDVPGVPLITQKVITTRFYGTTATNNANNPCKGATIRVCGEISTEIQEENNVSKVTETVTDENNMVINVSTTTVQASAEEVLAEIQSNLPSNAEIVSIVNL